MYKVHSNFNINEICVEPLSKQATLAKQDPKDKNREGSKERSKRTLYITEDKRKKKKSKKDEPN